MRMQSAHFLVKGKVQGVFFRANTKTKAEELGIRGWVKNTAGGDVEIVAQGSTDQLKIFEEWCRKGPARARVDDFYSDETDAEEFDSFKIVREK